MDWINNVTATMLNKSLDGVWARQRAISDNLANHETPNYKRKYVAFEDELKRALAQTDMKKSEIAENVKNTRVRMGVVNSETSRADGNNVSIEYEEIESVRAQFQYQALLQQMQSYYAGIRSAFTGGSK